MAPHAKNELPRKLPLLVLQDKVLLPGASMRIAVRDSASMHLINSRLLQRDTLKSVLIGVIPQQSQWEETGMSLPQSTGTAAVVVQVTGTNWPKPLYTLLVTGLCRFRVDKLVQQEPFVVAEVTQLDATSELGWYEVEIKKNADLVALAEEFRVTASCLVEMLDVNVPVVAKLRDMLNVLPDYSLPDTLASIVRATFREKLDILNSVDLIERFRKSLKLLKRQKESLQRLPKVRDGVIISESKRHKQLSRKAGNISLSRDINRINKSLDNDNEDEDEIEELLRKIRDAKLPEQAHNVAMKELKRLKKMPSMFPEHATTRNYLEWMVVLPWSKETKDKLDISQARKDLDNDHYGLVKLKKRVIEYLAVCKMKNSLKGPILCFVGPPGVGKTSVGRSIANTLGREFHRISLGGICDQSDIRGHRKTYVGAMPGRILNALKTVGTRNPVILLDEVDKMGKGIHGDPAAALLEVLDPEQNCNFVDHYLNIPFNLSNVLFIATANTASTIPAPLLDRMEVINVPGYTQEEKIAIATGHLIPKQLKDHGLEKDAIHFSEESLSIIISRYTREAGVRSLERKIGAICRAVTLKLVDMPKNGAKQEVTGNTGNKDANQRKETGSSTVLESCTLQLPFNVSRNFIQDVLGPPAFDSEVSQRLPTPGVAVGLAWTAMGGEILFVEATRMGGEGQLTLTGHLGDVMKESAQLALSWLRSHAVQYGIAAEHDTDLLEHTDVHVHFPAGAIGKDGPSAGVTIATVLVSLFSGRCVRSDTAMTGEITLRGLVLPVGGIKEKVLAAHRAGIRRIILPKRNEKDLCDIPDNVKSKLVFIMVSRVEEVLEAAFEDGFQNLARGTLTSKL